MLLNIENFINRIQPSGLEPSADAVELVKSLGVIDLHCDAILMGKNLVKDNGVGHVDFPRLVTGNVKIQVVAAATKLPIGFNHSKTKDSRFDILALLYLFVFPKMVFKSSFQRALHHAKNLKMLTEHPESSARMVLSATGFQANDSRTGIILALEGAHGVGEDVSNLRLLHDAGYRILGLSHFHDNSYAGSAHGAKKQGLTPKGYELLELSNSLSMIIDLAHASEQTICDVIQHGARAMCSHTGLLGHYQSPRNISDVSARLIADNGGVIGIGFWDDAVGSPAVSSIVDGIEYAINLVGEDHICLGSDFDGGTTVSADTADMPFLLASELLGRFPSKIVEKVLFFNANNFLSNNL
jgi:membrane dipeptidase